MNAIAVTFGSRPATFTVVSDTQINTVVPPGSSRGTVSVYVTRPSGRSNGIPYTYNQAAPIASTVTPDNGPVIGGNTVVITGSGFTNAMAVTFGSTPASFTVDSDTQITAIVPPGPSGGDIVSVFVTGPSGSSNGIPYTYALVLAPIVIGLNPAAGPVSGGTTVTITGLNFNGAMAVTFGGNLASSFTISSATQIVATAPPGTGGIASVVVITPGGSSTPNPGSEYTYTTTPLGTSVSPALGTTTGGDTVIITGSGFTGTTSVLFGNTPATSFTVVCDSVMNAVTPAHPAGTVRISITNLGGTDSSLSFSFVMPPVLTSISPTSGPTIGGTLVTITGQNLASTLHVNFGNAQVIPTSITGDTTVTAVSPAEAAGVIAVTVTTAAGTSNGLPFIYAM